MPKFVLGVNEGHLSTCALLKDGKITSCVSEERLNRVKGASGFPVRSVEFVLRNSGISAGDLDLVVLGFRQLQPLLPEFGSQTRSGDNSILLNVHRAIRGPWQNLEYHLPWLRKMVPITTPLYDVGYSHFAKVRIERIASMLRIPKERILTADHHSCHALTAIYGSPFRNRDFLVFTADGVGDGKCATVSVVKDRVIHPLSTTHMDNSLAHLYLEVTRHLGMKVLSDEYKVMGLAPYASESGVRKSYSVLTRLVQFDEKSRNFRSPYRLPLYYQYIRDNLVRHRFDHIAGAAQRLVEDLLVKWIRAWIDKTSISTICLAGGIFMNVKANMMIMQMPEVENLFVFPSPGDESTSFGAAYYGYQKLLGSDHLCDIEPLGALYLGPSFGNVEIEEFVNRGKHKENFDVEYHDDIDGVLSELLCRGKIVARMTGRMEWGARALGNRSILVDASDYKTVKSINLAIKQRDFWMPFAPTLLWERKEDYTDWTGKTDAPYMTMAFKGSRRAEEDLIAAIHPYDLTLRPQVLERQWNPSYYSVIKEFEGRTGRGGVLNTSFNLHGEPIVCSPADALRTFESSGLEYLVIENFVVKKRAAR